MRKLLFLVALLWAALFISTSVKAQISQNGCQAGGTCYYVDRLGGNDANSGLSKALAWQNAPGMLCATGVAAAHTFNQVDEFIFKGGVAWPYACFTWTITGGAAGTANSWAYPGMYFG